GVWFVVHNDRGIINARHLAMDVIAILIVRNLPHRLLYVFLFPDRWHWIIEAEHGDRSHFTAANVVLPARVQADHVAHGNVLQFDRLIILGDTSALAHFVHFVAHRNAILGDHCDLAMYVFAGFI